MVDLYRDPGGENVFSMALSKEGRKLSIAVEDSSESLRRKIKELEAILEHQVRMCARCMILFGSHEYVYNNFVKHNYYV